MISANLFPWGWAISALIIAYVELHAPGFYLIWIACAAAITSIISLNIDLSLSGQLIAFVISCGVTCIGGHFVYRHLMLPREGDPLLNRRNTEMIGAIGTVSEAFKNGQGKIRLGDSFWLAEGPDHLNKDASVIVTAVRGTTLIVNGY
jgi:membrane protein implicated in regulation of membrane protease activity